MKPLVIYHDNCADGFGAAFAAWTGLGDEAEYLPHQYNGPVDPRLDNPLNLSGLEIYVLDFSFQKERMDFLFTNAKRVVWLDHHKTAFEMWCKEYYPGKLYTQPLVDTASSRADNNDFRHTIILNDNKSGAMIAWEYFHPGKEIPILIKHIDDYDRWQFKLEGTKEFNKALWSYAPWSFEQWEDILGREQLGAYDEDNLKTFYAEGAAILRAHEQNVMSMVTGSARRCCIVNPDMPRSEHQSQPPWVRSIGGKNHLGIYENESVTGLAANCPPHLASDVGHQLAIKSGTYGLLWYINKDGKCLCSLRSNGNYDVSTIAKSFGGGGHMNAAGFEIDIKTLLEWIK